MNLDHLKVHGYFKYYDVRVRLGDGKQSISMNIGNTNLEENYVVYAAPEKIKILINQHNEGRHLPYLIAKAKGSWGALLEARIDKRVEDRVAFPTPYSRGLSIAQMDFYKAAQEVVGEFGDGATRSAWLVRQKAEFVPIIVRGSDGADLAYKLIGNGSPPILAKSFLVPDALREAMLEQYFCHDFFSPTNKIEIQKARRRRDICTRLSIRHFARHPLRESDFSL